MLNSNVTPFSTQRILIYRIENLGDIICTIPAMAAIRHHFPHVWIGLLTNKEATGNPDPEEILKNNDFLDEIIVDNECPRWYLYSPIMKYMNK